MYRIFDALEEKYGDEFNWHIVDIKGTSFVNEANREIKEGHALFGKKLYPVAKCDANDDVLFLMTDGEQDRYVIIHLVYNDGSSVEYPKFKVFDTVEKLIAYIENSMVM